MAPRKAKGAVVPKLEVPDTFLAPVNELSTGPDEELVTDPLDTIIGQHVAWLKAQKDRMMQLTGQKETKSRRKILPPLDALLEKYPIDRPMKENVEETPAPRRRQASVQQPQTGTGRMTRANMLRASEIKAEIESPAATPAAIHAKTPMPKSVARVKEEFASPRKEVASPRKEIRTRVASPYRHPVSKPVEDPKMDKYNKALERKKQQADQKAEKLRKENEEKKRRVEERRLQQEEDERKKRAEAIKKQEQAAELRRQHMSPARSRMASAMNTPLRMKPVAAKTPNNTIRTRLFDNTPSSARTPGRVPVKAAKLEHPVEGTAAIVNTNFDSNPREVKRKPVRPPVATPQEAQALKDAAAVLRDKQLRLLFEDDGEEERRRQERQAVEQEERRQREEEEERQRKEQERLERERRQAEKEEQRRAMEEAERKRAEQRRREKEEAERRAAEEAAEEERLREEEMARMQREQEEVGELVQKLDESMLEDPDEDMEDGYEEQQEQDESHISSYNMTMDKIPLPSTADNYNIEDLESGDETDDETAPRKKVPAWAEWNALTRLGLEQAKMDRDFDVMYGTMDSPHMQPIFKATKKPRRARGSSAQWNSPVTNPTKGKSRFLGV